MSNPGGKGRGTAGEGQGWEGVWMGAVGHMGKAFDCMLRHVFWLSGGCQVCVGERGTKYGMV